MERFISMEVSEMDFMTHVGNFIHYPQIIHTAFRAAVYPIAMNPARAFNAPVSIFLPAGCLAATLLGLIFSPITCIVKGNRNPPNA
jgi:hypothetical protein